MSEISEKKRDNLHSAIMNIPVESHQATNRDYKIGHRAALHAAAELVSEFVSKLPVSPSWQDRPTGPGLWMKRSGTVVMVVPHDMGHRHIKQWPGGRVFGPIQPTKGSEMEPQCSVCGKLYSKCECGTKPNPAEPVECWAVVGPDNTFRVVSCRSDKSESQEVADMLSRFKQQDGYRVARVRIEEIEESRDGE